MLQRSVCVVVALLGLGLARSAAAGDWPLWTDDYSDLLGLLTPPTLGAPGP